MNKNYIKRGCPSCDTSHATANLVMSSSPTAEELSFEKLQDYWRGFRKRSVFFSYYRCSVCELLFCPIYFSEDQLEVLYSDMGDNSAGSEFDSLKKTQSSYFQALQTKTKLVGHWIEIGADLGNFAKLLSDDPGVTSLTIIEPNLNSHIFLGGSVKGQGSLASNWSEISAESRFSGLVAIHVLDHLINLKLDLERIRQRLEAGGSVFFVTHDESSLLRKVLRSKWPPFCLQHPQIFSKNSMRRSLEIAGFNNIYIAKSSNFFTLRHIVTVVTALFGFGKSLLKITPKLTLKIQLGNIMTHAEKLKV